MPQKIIDTGRGDQSSRRDMSDINDNFNELYARTDSNLTNIVVVREASDLASIDSTKEYFIDGIVDMGNVSIEVPASGLTIRGYSFDLSGLTSSEDDYELFTSPVGGSGNLLLTDLFVQTSGNNSKVFDLVSNSGFDAAEFNRVNFIACTSLGSIDNYRQYLELGTGRFGGTPELEFIGTWNGARISTSIVRNVGDLTALFKAGLGLTFSSRFFTDINCDLPTVGALFDFSPSNFVNDETLEVENAIIYRDGVIDTSDTTAHPNINEDDVKCFWNGNVGIPNTVKYVKSDLTSEILTTISSQNTYVPLLGTFTLDTASHFDMPSNGEYRLLTGNGKYHISGQVDVEGNRNDVVDLRMTKSSDGGSTWPTEVFHIRRQINNLAGGRDIAFIPINGIIDLKKDDRLRLEIANQTSTTNVTAELDSYVIITGA